MSNHLINETSPYLLQHANNPVDWYPWGEEAFEKAGKEDKPIFLSIGYSTCHWCHVMAHESFEDEQVAALLNQYFVSIKVDKEERPDVDSVYMSVCQALTGGGGWPTTIFMTPEQKPFFAGTYFPKTARYGSIGFQELLLTIADKWEKNRGEITSSADEITKAVTKHGESQTDYVWMKNSTKEDEGRTLIEFAVQIFERTFDREHGGFGDAPKFPSPHNLLFLMGYYERCRINKNSGAKEVLSMVEKTLHQMYRGGIFDHIGGGFCRYSTDRYFLAPHFEKMLYDNAMMILAYSKAYQLTGNVLYRGVAEKTAIYILKEMTSAEGGFYSAQDADSEGVEGRFYLFEPIEVMQVLGQKVGKEFCGYFDITGEGNFEGKNIPNLLQNRYISARYNELLPALYEYRKKRYYLHLDDKVLTSWNGLMIAAMCSLYRITDKKEYLMSAMQAQEFVTRNLSEETMASGGRLFVSWRNGLRKGKGLLDDYANEIFALLALYEATLQKSYLEKAKVYLRKTISDFWDGANGGFFLSGSENERLFMRPKETYDGAIPSGNSMMTYNLVRYHYLTGERCYMEILEKQLQFICSAASHYPAAYAMAMLAIQDFLEMPDKVVVVLGDGDIQSNAITLEGIVRKIPLDTIVRVLEAPTEEYPLKNNKTTYYVCKGKVCYPPKNELQL